MDRVFMLDVGGFRTSFNRRGTKGNSDFPKENRSALGPEISKSFPFLVWFFPIQLTFDSFQILTYLLDFLGPQAQQINFKYIKLTN